MQLDTVDAQVAREVRAAGAVLWRPSGSGYEVAVVHRPRYDDWSLPKGKLDGGESEPVAAVREVAEETGSACVLGPFLARVSYSVLGERKVVDYFGARSTGGSFTPNDEVDELRWLPVAEARGLLSYGRDADVLDAFAALRPGVTTVLLVRHAKAGSRDGWVGDDDLRPLTPNGESQAESLCAQLRLFGPDRVFSAPRLRCVQTVRAIAAEQDVDISHEPLLSEDGYRASPREALARLAEIVDGGGTPLICSQGGVIPHLVADLAERDGVRLDDVPAKKASTWLLTLRPAAPRSDSHPAGPQLVAAHYLPPPPADA